MKLHSMYCIRNVFFVCGLAVATIAQMENHNSSKRIGIFTRPIFQISAIISDGIKAQTDIIKQGIGAQKGIIGQVPGLVGQSVVALSNSVLQAAEFPATAASRIILAGANGYIRAKRKQSIQLPALDTSLYGFGSFLTSRGRLSNLSTLSLDGRVSLQKSGLSLLIDIPAKLRELRVEYDSYSFSTWGVKLNGSIKADVKNNSLVIKVQILGSKNCTVNLRRIELQRLEDFQIDLGGGGGGYLSSITSYIANYLKETIKSEVQKTLDEQLSSYLNTNSTLLCSRFAHLNLL